MRIFLRVAMCGVLFGIFLYSQGLEEILISIVEGRINKIVKLSNNNVNLILLFMQKRLRTIILIENVNKIYKLSKNYVNLILLFM